MIFIRKWTYQGSSKQAYFPVNLHGKLFERQVLNPKHIVNESEDVIFYPYCN